DRAVPAFHPRDLLRPDHAFALGSRRALPYRGTGRAEERAMSTQSTVTRALTTSPLIAVTLYAAITGGLLLLAGLFVADVLAHRQALAQTSDLLDQLRGRKVGAGGNAASSADHPGTPFLEGPTVTVAGANLLQRVASAVANVGGSVQSSQVDVSG